MIQRDKRTASFKTMGEFVILTIVFLNLAYLNRQFCEGTTPQRVWRVKVHMDNTLSKKILPSYLCFIPQTDFNLLKQISIF